MNLQILRTKDKQKLMPNNIMNSTVNTSLKNKLQITDENEIREHIKEANIRIEMGKQLNCCQ